MIIEKYLDNILRGKKWKEIFNDLFYLCYPLERYFFAELLMMVLAIYFIAKHIFWPVFIIYVIRLVIYQISKNIEKMYPLHHQRYYNLLKVTVQNACELLFYLGIFINSYNQKSYLLFGITVIALFSYVLYQLLQLYGVNRKALSKIKSDLLVSVIIGTLIPFLLPYAIAVQVFIINTVLYEYMTKTMLFLRDNKGFSREVTHLKKKVAVNPRKVQGKDVIKRVFDINKQEFYKKNKEFIKKYKESKKK
jgi:hypothetical protein